MQLNHKFRLVPFSENEQVQNLTVAKQNLSKILKDSKKSESEKSALFGDLLQRLQNYVSEINEPPLVRVEGATEGPSVIKHIRIPAKRRKEKMTSSVPEVSKRRRRKSVKSEGEETAEKPVKPVPNLVQEEKSYAKVASPRTEAQKGKVVMIPAKDEGEEEAEPIIRKSGRVPKPVDRFSPSPEERKPRSFYIPNTPKKKKTQSGQGMKKFRVQLWRI